VKITELSTTELHPIIKTATETSRQHIDGMLTVKCNHPELGELVWIQGSGETIVMIQA